MWAFVGDANRYHEWVAFTDETGHVDEGDPREGFRYTEYGGVGQTRSESEWRIVEFDPPRRQVHVGDVGIADGELTVTVEPDGGGDGTRWTQRIGVEALHRLRPVGRLLEQLVVRRQRARGLERTMVAGKELVEREYRAASVWATAATCDEPGPGSPAVPVPTTVGRVPPRAFLPAPGGGVMDVAHTALWVSDLDEARDFFVDTLGLDEHRSYTRNGIDNVVVGGARAAIQLRTEPGREVPPERRDRMDHVALSVADVDGLCERLDAAGHDVFRPPETIEKLGVRIAFVRAPDGYAVEFVEQLG